MFPYYSVFLCVFIHSEIHPGCCRIYHVAVSLDTFGMQPHARIIVYGFRLYCPLALLRLDGPLASEPTPFVPSSADVACSAARLAAFLASRLSLESLGLAHLDLLHNFVRSLASGLPLFLAEGQGLQKLCGVVFLG